MIDPRVTAGLAYLDELERDLDASRAHRQAKLAAFLENASDDERRAFVDSVLTQGDDDRR